MMAGATTTDDATGDCFAIATAFATDDAVRRLCAAARIPYVTSEKGPFRIVHGLPIAQGGPAQGRRYWHAWVEIKRPGWIPLVWDLSNGLDYRGSRERYYQVGHLTDSTVWRFTIKEAQRLFRVTGHCGPWVDNWENMVVR